MRNAQIFSLCVLVIGLAFTRKSIAQKISNHDSTVKIIDTALTKKDTSKRNFLIDTAAIKVQKQIKASYKTLDSLNKAALKTKANIAKLSQTTNQLKILMAGLQKAYMDTTQLYRNQSDILKASKAQLLKDTTILSKQNKQLKKSSDSLKQSVQITQATIAKQKDSLEVIATMSMNDSVKVFKIGKKLKLFTTKVQSVHVLVQEGVILELVLVTDSGTFRNKASIIDLLHFGKRASDHLEYENQRYRPDHDSIFVYVGNAITYSPIRSYSDLPYSDFDITLTPTRGNRQFLLRESTSINTYFNVSAFTDLRGISGSANGIAQFSADAKFITNTKNIRNTSTVYLNYVSFTGNLSKYDSKFNGTQEFANDSVSRLNLLQRSTYQVGIKLNLLRSFASPYPHNLFDDVELNVGYNFVGSKIYITGYKDVAKTVPDTTYKSVTQNQWYIEPSITLNRHRNFSLTLSLPFEMLSIFDDAQIKNYKAQYWTCPSIDLMYFGKRDTGSKLFFRYHYYLNLSDKSQGFNQMQLGYSLNLTSVWSQKSSSN